MNLFLILNQVEDSVTVSKKHQNLEVSIIKVSKNKRKSHLTNFVAMSISKGHKTKFNSKFVLALSLSY